eukprot:TRINITY_DN8453_c0_g1_i1.p1 TRINITY_DN8453_c0_g1~~TRINITY_DN8453_c0_g1_i1.p1  ORF type:complete len:167 (+),score=0.11 TRINITY_DN8453_c0_g1_i1:214-714(+)
MKPSDVYINLFPGLIIIILILSLIANIIILSVPNYNDAWLSVSVILFNPLSPIILLVIFFTRFLDRIIEKVKLQKINKILLIISLVISAPTIILIIVVCIFDFYIDATSWAFFVYVVLFLIYCFLLSFTFFQAQAFITAPIENLVIHRTILGISNLDQYSGLVNDA